MRCGQCSCNDIQAGTTPSTSTSTYTVWCFDCGEGGCSVNSNTVHHNITHHVTVTGTRRALCHDMLRYFTVCHECPGRASQEDWAALQLECRYLDSVQQRDSCRSCTGHNTPHWRPHCQCYTGDSAGTIYCCLIINANERIVVIKAWESYFCQKV